MEDPRNPPFPSRTPGQIGPLNKRWKGDDASDTAGRNRAQRRYPLGPCERCGKPAVDRHHKDADTKNNARHNIEILCRMCHFAQDQRTAKALGGKPSHNHIYSPATCRICGHPFKPMRNGRCRKCDLYWRIHQMERPTTIQPRATLEKQDRSTGRPCSICGTPYFPMRKERCDKCYAYWRKYGVERPTGDLSPRAVTAQKKLLPCPRCGREAGIKGYPVRGYCLSCYRYLVQHGELKVTKRRKEI